MIPVLYDSILNIDFLFPINIFVDLLKQNTVEYACVASCISGVDIEAAKARPIKCGG